MAPPAKRRKTNTIAESSDDEDISSNRNGSLDLFLSSPSSKTAKAQGEEAPTSRATLPVRKSAQSVKGSHQTNVSAKVVNGSPQKKGKSQKVTAQSKPQTSDLRTLFQRQSQLAGTREQFKSEISGSQVDEIASDPISEDDEITAQKISSSSLVSKKATKRFGVSTRPGSSHSSKDYQRFSKPPESSASPSITTTTEQDHRPWSEKYEPRDLEELVVHKKKVSDVRRWLEDVFRGRLRQRLLVLKGSAGTGKTTTIQLLARELGYETLPWRNPGSNVGGLSGSQATQFEEFLGRGGRFGQLDVDGDTIAPSVSTSTPPMSLDGSQKTIITIEEFPTTFMRSGSALVGFRRTLLEYLASSLSAYGTFGRQASDEPIIPIVIIISETLLTTTSASADSFTAHRLLGPEILRHPGTGVIEFNDIAPTLMIKALQLIVSKESRQSGRRKTPGPQVLKRLAEIGDIRNAVANLEFLCLKGDENADWGARTAPTKGKKSAKDQALTPGEQESLQLISQREASLGIFHAVGKVVYNKREEQAIVDTTPEAEAEKLPEHLAEYSRRFASLINPETLMDETGTDTATFISALHENYVLSCERSSTADPHSAIDYIEACIDLLSEADLLNPSWDVFYGSKGYVNYGREQGSHVVRQDEMAFQLAVRGLVFSLPSPVKRIKSAVGQGRNGGDAFKMYYPSSIKLWKTKEEIESLLDMWSIKTINGESAAAKAPAPKPLSQVLNGSNAFRKPKSTSTNTKKSSVGDWAGNRLEMAYVKPTVPTPAPGPAAEDHEPTTLLSLGSSARTELVLDRLPYLALIHRKRPGSNAAMSTYYSMSSKDLEKVVSFHGIGAPQNEDAALEDSDDDQTHNGEPWATDKPTEEGGSPRKNRSRPNKTVPMSNEEAGISGSKYDRLRVDKLVLSDDDIED